MMNQLEKYIVALTYLYGVVHKEKVLEIYNQQNDQQITIDQIEAYFAEEPIAIRDSFAYPYNDYFVHETVLAFDEFDELLKEKGDKPYYIPVQKELLKYTNDHYFEKSKAYKNLFNYIRKNFYPHDQERAKDLAEDTHDFCQMDFDIKLVLDNFARMGAQFEGEKQVNEVLSLVMELHNNVRLWENNGYTPSEMFHLFEKDKLNPLPNQPFDFNKTNIIDFKTKQKIGRNDPCPCGSGKKFKKCCLSNDS